MSYRSRYNYITTDYLKDTLKRKPILDAIEANKDKYNEFFGYTYNIILLGLGGSYSYGTNIETSDLDIRGIYINPLKELLGTYIDSEQYLNTELDITVYSLKKMFKLLANCNPNTIELLGLRDEDYLYKDNELADMLIKNGELFLSKRAIYTFGNYALSQLNRLINRSGRANDEIVNNEIRTYQKVLADIKGKYKGYIKNANIYNINENIELDLNISNISIEKFDSLHNDIINVHKQYKKSKRNDYAIAHGRIAKHMMHLIRLYMMGYDILKNGIIKTYRDGTDHELLMSIRNGDYLTGKNGTVPTDAFNKIMDEYKHRFDIACDETKLPDYPDWELLSNLHQAIVSSYYNL